MGEAILYQLHSLLAATALGFCRLALNFLFVTIFRQWEYTNSSSSPNNNSGIMCISSALPL